MSKNGAGDIRKSAIPLSLSHQMVIRGCWCYGVEVTSARFRTYLHKVDITVTIQYYLSNIFNPIIIPMHKQHRPEFLLMDDKAAAHHVRIIIAQLWKAGVTQMDWPASPLTQI